MRHKDFSCTVFMAVPAMYTKLLDHIGTKHVNFNGIRLLASGSAPLSVKEFERITEKFNQEPIEREGKPANHEVV